MAHLKDYSRLPTEQPNPYSRHLDKLSTAQLVDLMNRQDYEIPKAIGRVKKEIVRGVELISSSLSKKGRLFFVGAGTSGRLCVMEAAECPPTFNTPIELVQSIMAGGSSSVFRSKEGAEDRALEAKKEIQKKVRKGDVVVGVAASGVTPFVLMALSQAEKRKAKTILVTCNSKQAVQNLADVLIAPVVGPEVLTGSTRLKAGSATKMVLNMLTTLTMVRLGKVYDHWMVDLQPKSQKLVARGIRLIQHLGNISEKEALSFFKKARGNVKTAILIARLNVDLKTADKKLAHVKGHLRKALENGSSLRRKK